MERERDMSRMTMIRILVLALFFAGHAATAWCQSDPLGPHDVNGRGCVLCHFPNAVQAVAVSSEAEDLFWARESATLETASSPGSMSPERPLFHTFICLTCHDGSLASLSMMGKGIDQAKGVSASDPDLARTNDAHPVHVPYLPNDGCGVPSATCNPDHWPSKVDARGTLAWVGSALAATFTELYGRPARFFPTPENGGQAMVECASCHNPHSLQSVQYKLNGQVQLKPSRAFLRGWYETEGRHQDTVSKFCRSCHFSQSIEFVNMRD